MKLWSVKVEQYMRGAEPGCGLYADEDYIVRASSAIVAARKALSKFKNNGKGPNHLCRKPEVTKVEIRDEIFA